MKKAFRRNQIVVSALAIMIAVAGYLTYAGKDGAGELYPANEAAQSGDTYIAGNLTVSDQEVIQEKNSAAASSSAAESASQTVASEAAASTSAAQESSADAVSQAESGGWLYSGFLLCQGQAGSGSGRFPAFSAGRQA